MQSLFFKGGAESSMEMLSSALLPEAAHVVIVVGIAVGVTMSGACIGAMIRTVHGRTRSRSRRKHERLTAVSSGSSQEASVRFSANRPSPAHCATHVRTVVIVQSASSWLV